MVSESYTLKPIRKRKKELNKLSKIIQTLVENILSNIFLLLLGRLIHPGENPPHTRQANSSMIRKRSGVIDGNVNIHEAKTRTTFSSSIWNIISTEKLSHSSFSGKEKLKWSIESNSISIHFQLHYHWSIHRGGRYRYRITQTQHLFRGQKCESE